MNPHDVIGIPHDPDAQANAQKYSRQPLTAPCAIAPDPHGFVEKYGLHPLPAAGAIALDYMLFGTLEAPSFELLAFISFMAGLAAILPFALIQKHCYPGESWGAAWGKAMLLGLLTAIPTPLPSFLTAGWGVIGFLGAQAKRARERDGLPPEDRAN